MVDEGSGLAQRLRTREEAPTLAPRKSPRGYPDPEEKLMKIVKLLAATIGLLVAAAVVIPLVVLAGLFIWLKLTEEADEEALELEQEQGTVA